MTSATPRGGWLHRIETGTAAVFTEPEPDTEQYPQVHLTERMRQIVTMMLPGPGGRRRWFEPLAVARATGIPVGTVTPVLSRLAGVGWLESERIGDSHHRHFRLTDAGVAGTRAEAVDAAPEPEPEPLQLNGYYVAHDVPPQRRVDDAGEKVWTFAELARKDPALAALVRRKLAGGEDE